MFQKILKGNPGSLCILKLKQKCEAWKIGQDLSGSKPGPLTIWSWMPTTIPQWPSIILGVILIILHCDITQETFIAATQKQWNMKNKVTFKNQIFKFNKCHVQKNKPKFECNLKLVMVCKLGACIYSMLVLQKKKIRATRELWKASGTHLLIQIQSLRADLVTIQTTYPIYKIAYLTQRHR